MADNFQINISNLDSPLIYLCLYTYPYVYSQVNLDIL